MNGLDDRWPEGLEEEELLKAGRVRAGALGIRSGGRWSWAWTPAPIVVGQAEIRAVSWDPGSEGLAEERFAWQKPLWPRFYVGHRLEYFGPSRIIGARAYTPPGGAHLRIPTAAGDNRLIRLWDFRAYAACGIYARMRRTPHGEQQFSVHGFGPDLSAAEWRSARRALAILQRVLHDGRGRPRTEQDPAKLALARQARQLRRKHPTWTNARIVYYLRMVDEDEITDDPLSERRAVSTAIRRLQHYERGLREFEGG